jgi:hypothetical protein
MIGRFAGAAIVAAALLSPYLIEYLRVHESMGFARGVDDEQPASWVNFLSTSARVHYTWSKPFAERATSNTFPGIVAMALVVLAFSDKRTRADARFRMCAIAAAGCVAVSFAPLLPFYAVLHRAIPLFQMVRVLAQLGQVVLLLIAVLAAFGVATLRQRWPHTPSWPIAAVVLVCAVNAEAMRERIGYTWFDGVPAIYDTIAQEPNAAIVELPFPLPQQWFLNTPYMVNSTRHWRPMLNGYSGFRPPSYYRHYDLMRKFPSDEALIQLAAEGVTHVVVHQREMNLGAADARYNPFEQVQTLQLVARDADILIYRLR